MGGGGSGQAGEAATVKALVTVALVTGGGDNDLAGAAAKVRAGAATVDLNGAGASVDDGVECAAKFWREVSFFKLFRGEELMCL
jgi:hypothetical protein